ADARQAQLLAAGQQGGKRERQQDLRGRDSEHDRGGRSKRQPAGASQQNRFLRVHARLNSQYGRLLIETATLRGRQDIVSIGLRHFAIPCLILWSVSSFAQTRQVAAARASASLDELARLPKNRAVASDGLQRESHEPERAVRRRNSAKPSATPARQPDNFTAIPPDTEGAVGPRHVVTMLNTQVMIHSRGGFAREKFPITLNAF